MRARPWHDHGVRALLPEPSDDLDDLGLAAHYAEPLHDEAPQRGWLRANMVSSVDGAATVDGASRGLGAPADQRLLGVLRALADVIVVGASTVRVEQYGPARVRPSLLDLRRERGQTEAATLAVVSGRLDLDPAAPLFTEARQPTLVITHAAAPRDRRHALEAVADVIVCGEERVDLVAAVHELTRRGLRRQLTEGGPHLLGQLLTAGLVDELAVSLSPMAAGPGASRIVAGQPAPAATPTPLTLAGLLIEDDMLFARYLVREPA